MAITHDVTQTHQVAENSEVDEPPYRMVPGNDLVCTRSVLRRFKKVGQVQPSKSQQRKKNVRWNRGAVSGFLIAEILTKKAGTDHVNAQGSGGALKMAEHYGHHITYVGRIGEVHVRWHGPSAEENTRLSEWAEILRQAGYTVVPGSENNVDWPQGYSRKFIITRKNRQFLRVAKFHRQQRQKR